MRNAIISLAALILTSAVVFGAGEDKFYKLGPDSLPQDGVPKGKLIGPATLPSNVFPGTVHTYYVYVPAQYDPKVPAVHDLQRRAGDDGARGRCARRMCWII